MVEEGIVCDKSVKLKSIEIGRISFAKPPAVEQLERTYSLNENDILEITADMSTNEYDSCCKRHITATYKKVGSKIAG